jgi:hypothetical protein
MGTEMDIMTRLMNKVWKISASEKTRQHIASLLQEAYEAGKRDGIEDVRITLEDLAETDAVEIIESNYPGY